LLELDLWLERFVDSALNKLTEQECATFEALLQEADVDLLAWLEGRQTVPERHAALIEKIRLGG
jgi:antitoxin CptB